MASDPQRESKRKTEFLLKRIREVRPDRPSDRIMARAVELMNQYAPIAKELVLIINRLHEMLKNDIPDASFFLRKKKTLSQAKTGAALMVYEPRPCLESGRWFVGAVCNTVVFKTNEIRMLITIEPGFASDHLYSRIIERAGGAGFDFAATQQIFSDVYLPLLWMRSYRHRVGRGSIPYQFFVPRPDGMFFGNIETIEGKDLVPHMAPQVVVVNDHGTNTHTLYDVYSNGKKRIMASTKTFVDLGKLKDHQKRIHVKVSEFGDRYADVIAYLRNRWMIASDDNSEYAAEIRDIFKVTKPAPQRMDEAMSALEDIVESPEWQLEVAKSAESQTRHQAKALIKAAS